jgi:N-acetylglutamate synthase-like GNAT family acetyltransferase
MPHHEGIRMYLANRNNECMIIRKARSEDFKEIYVLLKQLWEGDEKEFNEKKLEHMFNRMLTSELRELICAEIDNNIVGYCALSMKEDLYEEGICGRIDEMVIDKSLRGKGIGSKLLVEIIAKAKEKGCKSIELNSATHRKDAHKFYEKNGFEMSGYAFYKEL